MAPALPLSLRPALFFRYLPLAALLCLGAACEESPEPSDLEKTDLGAAIEEVKDEAEAVRERADAKTEEAAEKLDEAGQMLESPGDAGSNESR